MGENAAVANLSAGIDRAKTLRVLGLQAAVVIAVALVWFVCTGTVVSAAVLVGGGAYLLPSFVLTWVMFAIVNARATSQVAIVLFLGEFIKLLFCAAVIAVTIVGWPELMWSTLAGVLAVQVGSWFAPVLNRLKTR